MFCIVLPNQIYEICCVHIPQGFSSTLDKGVLVPAQDRISIYTVFILPHYFLNLLPSFDSLADFMFSELLSYSYEGGYLSLIWLMEHMLLHTLWHLFALVCQITLSLWTLLAATKTDCITAGVWETWEHFGEGNVCNRNTLLCEACLCLEKLPGDKMSPRDWNLPEHMKEVILQHMLSHQLKDCKSV